VERQAKYPNASGEFTRFMIQIGTIGKIIANQMKHAALNDLTGTTGQTNVQGESVKPLDLIGNQAFIEALEYVDIVGILVSEEMEEPKSLESKGQGSGYAVMVDPIDGSSNIDNMQKPPTLQDLRLRINERFVYEYSFFEWWQHRIRLEKRLPIESGKTYPVCIAGFGAAPPEDCGGIYGFMRLREHFSQAYILDRFIAFLRYIVHEIPPDEDETDDDGIMARFRDEFRTLNYWFYADKCDRPAKSTLEVVCPSR
jgi:hypothetical protein